MERFKTCQDVGNDISMMNWNTPVFEAPSFSFEPQIIWEPQPPLCSVSKQQKTCLSQAFLGHSILVCHVSGSQEVTVNWYNHSRGFCFFWVWCEFGLNKKGTPVGLGGGNWRQQHIPFRWKWKCTEFTTDQTTDQTGMIDYHSCTKTYCNSELVLLPASYLWCWKFIYSRFQGSNRWTVIDLVDFLAIKAPPLTDWRDEGAAVWSKVITIPKAVGVYVQIYIYIYIHTVYCFVWGVVCYQAHLLLESRTFSILHEKTYCRKAGQHNEKFATAEISVWILCCKL